MPRIRPLSPDVINKIAAGEVIERPASVVKELLENSLDALATRIEVDIGQGGSELIRVVDDGEGIHADDLTLVVASHATSKISSDDDLFRVRTMGFRGEAMASIASVSRMRIRSRCPSADTGHEIEVNSGELGPVQSCGCPVGTLVEIRQLFANTPVRRKFLKSTATEFGHISEQFTRIALGHPRLHAVLRHNGKLVYELPPTADLMDRLRLFYGGEMADALISVDAEFAGARLWGYVGHPSESRSTRKGQYLFLNGRWIQDRTLQHALGEAYRGLLMTGRYPVAFLFLELPPDLVDVNVHPTKAEVRFRDGQQLYRLMLSTLRTRFLGMELDSGMRIGARAPQPLLAPVSAERQQELQNELADWAKGQLGAWQPDDSESEGRVVDPSEIDWSTITTTATEDDRDPAADETETDAGFPWRPPAPAPGSVPAPHMPAPAGERANVVQSDGGRAMQVLDCYLVLETDAGLTVIDQHALHERVIYEHLRRRVLSGAVESQRLLVPETIELGTREAAALIEHRELLGQLGFTIEEFGRTTVLLQGYPPMLARADLGRLVRDVADQLSSEGRQPSRRDLLDSLLHMMSCKAAVKAGQRLTPEEMDSLLAQRHLIDDAHHCPHGRPTALVLSRNELDRQFGRLG